MSAGNEDVRTLLRAKKIRAIQRQRSKRKHSYAGRDQRRDDRDAEEAGFRIRKWKHK